jgi:hypothetical protein
MNVQARICVEGNSNSAVRILIVVPPRILISTNYLHQRMHYLLKHKILQFLFKYFFYIAPTCFGPLGPSSGSTYQNLAKVTKITVNCNFSNFSKVLICAP